ncbi:hypothetical protein JR316_0006734 [Psilocybe cubensis]|uniref:Uncharacterized protein n=2 Tax=Psilocybe cubensis TaxID=181762 RepID=A0A8H8CFJ5_PSICU|nr:hypothetical protein JR316_0006734 [Psilocybe cubensis]KAH9480137.1 hypothetical protein JR316_0006734 [Psilocybe cubensis]
MYNNLRDSQHDFMWPVHHSTASASSTSSSSQSDTTAESFYTGVNTIPPSHGHQLEDNISTITGSFRTALSFAPVDPMTVEYPEYNHPHDLPIDGNCDNRHLVKEDQPTFDLTDSSLIHQAHIAQLQAAAGGSSLTHGGISQSQGVDVGIPIPRYRAPERQKRGARLQRSFGEVPRRAQGWLSEASLDVNPRHHMHHSQRLGEATVDVIALHSEMIQLRQQVVELKSIINASSISQANLTTDTTQSKGGLNQKLGKKSRAAVRQEIDDLLGHPNKYKFTRLATQEDIETFEPLWRNRRDNSLECCDIDDFKVDLYTNPSSGWNNSAGWVFARHYAAKVETDFSVQDIQRHFITRMRSLKRSFKVYLENDEEKAKLQKYHRRLNRKKDKLRRQITICEEEPLARPHLGIMQGLGLNGMSSEDSDYPPSPDVPLRIPSQKQFVVLRPIWRAREITPWIHIFDLLWAHRRDVQEDGRGKQPVFRIRMIHTVSYDTPIVQGLHHNAYDLPWITSPAGNDTQYNPVMYDFTYSPGLMQ